MKNEKLWSDLLKSASDIQRTIVKNEASLSDEQIVMAANSTRELFKILEAEQRKMDENSDVITMITLRSHELNCLMKQRMLQYQESTGNTDCGIFPYTKFNIDKLLDISILTKHINNRVNNGSGTSN